MQSGWIAAGGLSPNVLPATPKALATICEHVGYPSDCANLQKTYDPPMNESNIVLFADETSRKQSVAERFSN